MASFSGHGLHFQYEIWSAGHQHSTTGCYKRCAGLPSWCYIFVTRREELQSCFVLLSRVTWIIRSDVGSEIKMTLAHRIIAVPCRTSYVLYLNTKRVFCEICGWICGWFIHCGLLRRFVLLAVDAHLSEEPAVSIFMIAEVTLTKMLTFTPVTLNQCCIISL
jgi:hypothetical protein